MCGRIGATAMGGTAGQRNLLIERRQLETPESRGLPRAASPFLDQTTTARRRKRECNCSQDLGVLCCAERAIAIGLGERFDLYRFQCDLLRQHDVTDGQVALWAEAPLGDHIASGIEFLIVHGPTVPDAVSPAGVGPDNVEMPAGIP
jgi:hypothetical protein